MRKIALILATVLFLGCSAVKETASYDHDFKMVNSIVYYNDMEYATLKCINYGIRDGKEFYEAVFVVQRTTDASISRKFVEYMSMKKSNLDIKIETAYSAGNIVSN